MTDFEERLFKRSRAAGPRASLDQWGLDKGHHQEDWDPCSSLPESVIMEVGDYAVPAAQMHIIEQVIINLVLETPDVLRLSIERTSIYRVHRRAISRRIRTSRGV